MAKKLVCSGIVNRTGFNVYPRGESPTYVSFDPGQATEVNDVVAAHLIKQDPTRFLVVDAEPKKPVTVGAAPVPQQQEAKRHVKNNRKKRTH